MPHCTQHKRQQDLWRKRNYHSTKIFLVFLPQQSDRRFYEEKSVWPEQFIHFSHILDNDGRTADLPCCASLACSRHAATKRLSGCSSCPVSPSCSSRTKINRRERSARANIRCDIPWVTIIGVETITWSPHRPGWQTGQMQWQRRRPPQGWRGWHWRQHDSTEPLHIDTRPGKVRASCQITALVHGVLLCNKHKRIVSGFRCRLRESQNEY